MRTQNWNDLNQTDGTAGISDLSLRQLEEEKTKLLAQAAAELREENTREEKILEVAKRLAVLKGKDPETGMEQAIFTSAEEDFSLFETNLGWVMGKYPSHNSQKNFYFLVLGF